MSTEGNLHLYRCCKRYDSKWNTCTFAPNAKTPTSSICHPISKATSCLCGPVSPQTNHIPTSSTSTLWPSHVLSCAGEKAPDNTQRASTDGSATRMDRLVLNHHPKPMAVSNALSCSSIGILCTQLRPTRLPTLPPSPPTGISLEGSPPPPPPHLTPSLLWNCTSWRSSGVKSLASESPSPAVEGMDDFWNYMYTVHCVFWRVKRWLMPVWVPSSNWLDLSDCTVLSVSCSNVDLVPGLLEEVHLSSTDGVTILDVLYCPWLRNASILCTKGDSKYQLWYRLPYSTCCSASHCINCHYDHTTNYHWQVVGPK